MGVLVITYINIVWCLGAALIQSPELLFDGGRNSGAVRLKTLSLSFMQLSLVHAES